MDSSLKKTLENNGSMYQEIGTNNQRTTKNRSFLWILCGVIASMVIIGAATNGFISPKPMTSSATNFQGELRGSAPPDLDGYTTPSADLNKLIDPRFQASKKTTGEADKPSGPVSVSSAASGRKSSNTNFIVTSPVDHSSGTETDELRTSTHSSAELTSYLKEWKAEKRAEKAIKKVEATERDEKRAERDAAKAEEKAANEAQHALEKAEKAEKDAEKESATHTKAEKTVTEPVVKEKAEKTVAEPVVKEKAEKAPKAAKESVTVSSTEEARTSVGPVNPIVVDDNTSTTTDIAEILAEAKSKKISGKASKNDKAPNVDNKPSDAKKEPKEKEDKGDGPVNPIVIDDDSTSKSKGKADKAPKEEHTVIEHEKAPKAEKLTKEELEMTDSSSSRGKSFVGTVYTVTKPTSSKEEKNSKSNGVGGTRAGPVDLPVKESNVVATKGPGHPTDTGNSAEKEAEAEAEEQAEEQSEEQAEVVSTKSNVKVSKSSKTDAKAGPGKGPADVVVLEDPKGSK